MQDKIELSVLRLQKAKDCLQDSSALIESGGFRSSVNRSYYAVFHSLRAVLVFDGYDSKKHSGIISEFRRVYIKSGEFKEDISRIIGQQFDLRSMSDYDDFFSVSEEAAEKALCDARYVVEETEKYLKNRYGIV